MKVYVVRHGQSTNNANIESSPDPALTQLGVQQAHFAAQALTEELKSEHIVPSAIYVSPHRRTLQTAEPIWKALGATPNVLPSICEAGGVSDTHGMSRSRMQLEWPDLTFDAAVTEVEIGQIAVYGVFARDGIVEVAILDHHLRLHEAGLGPLQRGDCVARGIVSDSDAALVAPVGDVGEPAIMRGREAARGERAFPGIVQIHAVGHGYLLSAR